MSASEIDPPEGFSLERDPASVPTPLAIAAADFCRRAGRPSPPEAVRLALARLRPEEDSELLALFDEEPPARPLGPEALIDLLRGLPAEEAAAREESGYYLALAEVPREPPPSTPRAALAPTEGSTRRQQQREVVLQALTRARGNLPRTAEELGLSEPELQLKLQRLSLVRRARQLEQAAPQGAAPPRVRKAGERKAATRPGPTRPPLLPKRGAGRPPLGRMAQGTPHSRDASELRGSQGRETLRKLVEAFRGNRRTMLRRLNELYRTHRANLKPADLEALLAEQGLIQEAEDAEREHLRFLFTSTRGDLGQVASKLKLTALELRQELEERGLWQAAERLRDRFRRELFSKPLTEQLHQILKRQKYLQDLSIQEKLEKSVGEQAQRAWDAVRDEPASERRRALAERLGVNDETARALIKHFRLG